MYQYSMKIFLMLLFLISFSVSAKEDVVKVYDKGMDGGMRIYTVVCPNGKKTSVTRVVSISGGEQNLETQQQTVKLSGDSKTGKSVKSTVQDIKKRALKLLGQQNRAEMCLYPVNSKKQCKSYNLGWFFVCQNVHLNNALVCA